jgi:LuxR family maltose regulon positive regulatory protein
MGVPLVETKLYVPQARRTLVPRKRLTERLSRASHARLTLVSAPAGFGKTTVLAAWLEDHTGGGGCVAWVSLEASDSEPSTFWAYLAAALERVVPGVREAAQALVQSPQPPTDAAFAPFLNELGSVTDDVFLVLDDYHLVDEPGLQAGMTYLLEHLPPQVHLVISTRADPALPLARLRSSGDLVEVRAADLRFTPDEVTAYLNGVVGLGLTPSDVAVLEARTEGWIAALQLAALSLEDRDDVGSFIAGFAGDDRYVVDYLIEEVLQRQPEPVRTFLVRTCLLDQLTGGLCDAVTGERGGKAILERLDRANLFVVPLDDNRQWYRYHHLFADMLRARLLDVRPDEVPELHRRASAWFEADGDIAQAIRHAQAAGDIDRAADLMELATPQMQRDRREAELAHWVRTLPDEVVQERPVLGIALVGALALVSDFATVGRRLDDIERSVRGEGAAWPEQPPPHLIVVDHERYRALPAAIEMYRSALALARGDLEGTVRHARAALALAPDDDDLVRAAAGALGGLASWATGDLEGAHAAYSAAVERLARVGSVADVLGCSVTLGELRRTQGRLDDAVRDYRWALDLAARTSPATPLRGTADMHVGLAGVALERGDLATAEEELAVSERLGEHLGLPQNPYRRRVNLARLREAQGDLDAALQLLDEADRVYDGDYSPNVQPVPAVRARLLVRRGELAQAEAWAQAQGLSPEDEPSYLREYEHLTLARILLARHQAGRAGTRLAEATVLLERLLAAAESGGRGARVIEVLVLQALARQAEGDLPAALTTLRRAVALAEPEGFVRVFADEGASMAALLKALSRQAGIPGFTRRLLLAATRVQREPAAPTGLVEPLSDRELDVLRLLGTDLAGPEIARELSVSLNTVRTHTKNIYAKLGVTSRRAAVRQAGDLNLLTRR